MPELLDQHLDADIARTLKFNALVTPVQHEDARTRLLRSAAAQTALPPVKVAEPMQVPLRTHSQAVREQMIRVWRFLVVDSICFERAHHPPMVFRYYYMHGRSAFKTVHVAA
jgi:hypothetical protein